MPFETILMAVAALLPAVILLIFIYKKDRVEKEPVWLLLLLLVGGALICYPAAWLEELIAIPIDGIFSNAGYVQDGVTYLGGFAYRLYQLLSNFIGVALVEEGLKWIVLFLVTRKNKNFNSYFDGLIYAVCVSLGFAALENIKYVFLFGWANAALRAVTAVPGHMFDGVIMGMFYTEWNVFRKALALEKQGKKEGAIRIEKFTDVPKSKLLLSIIVPVLTHGFYDYCCEIGSVLSMIVFIAFLIGLYIFCFKKIVSLSKSDMNDEALAVVLLMKNHPEMQALYEAYMRQKTGTAAPAPASASGTAAAGTSASAGTYTAPARPATSPAGSSAPTPQPTAYKPQSSGSADSGHPYKGVYSPVSGMLIDISVNLGNTVMQGEPIAFVWDDATGEVVEVRSEFTGTVAGIFEEVGTTINGNKPIISVQL